MDERPRNLKAMLSEAKDTSELMVDLGYAALFFADPAMAEEVVELEERLTSLIHEMRAFGVWAARSPRDADEMAGVLGIGSSMERMGGAAVDGARIVTHRLGIPNALVADLAAAEEVSHRVRVREDSAMAGRRLCDLELPTEVGMRVVALRRGKGGTVGPARGRGLPPHHGLITPGPGGGRAPLPGMARGPRRGHRHLSAG